MPLLRMLCQLLWDGGARGETPRHRYAMHRSGLTPVRHTVTGAQAAAAVQTPAARLTLRTLADASVLNSVLTSRKVYTIVCCPGPGPAARPRGAPPAIYRETVYRLSFFNEMYPFFCPRSLFDATVDSINSHMCVHPQGAAPVALCACANVAPRIAHRHEPARCYA